MQPNASDTITILMADDDADDRMLAQDAMAESRLGNAFRCVEDGQELMDYLNRAGRYATEDAPRPGLILLDLMMPGMDGYQFRAEQKRHLRLLNIPVLLMTAGGDPQGKASELGVGGSSSRMMRRISSYAAVAKRSL